MITPLIPNKATTLHSFRFKANEKIEFLPGNFQAILGIHPFDLELVIPIPDQHCGEQDSGCWLVRSGSHAESSGLRMEEGEFLKEN